MTTKVPDNFTGTLPNQQRQRRRAVGGLALIIIGVLALLLQTNVLRGNLWPLLFLPALGLIFLLWGMLTRRGGLLIPGGILLGLGAGSVLTETVFNNLDDPQKGGVVLLSFGLGWALITLTSAIFADRVMWWPLIPGGIMLALGIALMLGVLDTAATVINVIWPAILIIIGLWIILRRRN